MSDLLNYYKRQNEEQREVIKDLEKTLESKEKEIYEVKQSIFRELAEVVKIGQSNDIYKNMKMLDKLEVLKNDLYFDVQEYLEEQLQEDYKKELISDWQSQN